ncbi:MAG: hypothetical protein KGQ49_05240 [Verrucomicrobia bacterium]|nr:hypothetical protein [Verrucomicrobiota bacterium]MBU6446785.1 hypothetical protein [Verrucomicrobiota bacterium]
MFNHPGLQLPIRSKLDMLNDIVQIVCYLHEGNRKEGEKYILDLKLRSLFMDETIQNRVLVFTDQVHFQFNYDPYHKMNSDIQQAADHLIEAMGFQPPKDDY